MPSVRERLAEVQALAARVLVTPGPPITWTLNISDGRPPLNCQPSMPPVVIAWPQRVHLNEARQR